MEMEDDQQQQGPRINSSILDGIARLANPRYRDERHKLTVSWCCSAGDVDRPSLQHLVHFLVDDDSHEVTELVLDDVILLQPSDSGLEILRSFFARSDTTLTKVTLLWCNFGTADDASQLLSAFQTNTTVTDLIQYNGLRGVALGNCLSGVMQSMPQLQRLFCHLSVEGIRAFQPALQANRTLRELGLSCGHFGDEGIRIVADSLAGNTTIEVLDISHNDISSNGLDDITRMIESKQIKRIDLECNRYLFNNESSTQRFARVLSRHKFLKDLNLGSCQLRDNGIRIIADGLVGNTIMESLDISDNVITSVGLADITRLLVSTQLKRIYFVWANYVVFHDEDATQHFVTTLQHQKSRVQELPRIQHHLQNFPGGIRAVADRSAASYASIMSSLIRNHQLNRANLLLAPPPPQQQQQRNAGTMMLKLSHKAITKFAMAPNNAGASAIFTLFQARPALLEKRIKRPASADVSQEQTR